MQHFRCHENLRIGVQNALTVQQPCIRSLSAKRCAQNVLVQACAGPQPIPLSLEKHEVLSRRTAFLGLTTAAILPGLARAADALEQQQDAPATTLAGVGAVAAVDYSMPGPLAAAPFPELEHTCTRCFPACIGNRCMLSLDVVYPKNGKARGKLFTHHPC